jgi:hypothetical protein
MTAQGPGEARTILLLHIISVRPSKQPLMVRTFLKVYMELGSYFLFLQEQIKDIIITLGHELARMFAPPGACVWGQLCMYVCTGMANSPCSWCAGKPRSRDPRMRCPECPGRASVCVMKTRSSASSNPRSHPSYQLLRAQGRRPRRDPTCGSQTRARRSSTCCRICSCSRHTTRQP